MLHSCLYCCFTFTGGKPFFRVDKVAWNTNIYHCFLVCPQLRINLQSILSTSTPVMGHIGKSIQDLDVSSIQDKVMSLGKSKTGTCNDPYAMPGCACFFLVFRISPCTLSELISAWRIGCHHAVEWSCWLFISIISLSYRHMVWQRTPRCPLGTLPERRPRNYRRSKRYQTLWSRERNETQRDSYRISPWP